MNGLGGDVIINSGLRLRARAIALLLALLACVVTGIPASALDAIIINPDVDRLEITGMGEYFDGRGDNLQVETAPGPDGVAGRMGVRATTPGTSPGWIVFALRNTTDRPIERWLTAERYTVTGSGVVWPDLDAGRIEALTPSVGFFPERVRNDRADIFKVTIDPGQTITYAAELASNRFARVYLWKPLEYELKARDRQLFNGVMLGITGVLALFLTMIFAANHKSIFPTTALLTACVLAHLCVEFGFWHKLFQLRPEDNAVYRAATEAAIAAGFVIFLHSFLRLGSWHGFIRMLVGVWIVAQLALIAVAIIDPRLASTFARGSFALIAGVGGALTIFLAVRGQDRALSLIPSWILFSIWVFAAAVVLSGRLSGDLAVSGLVAGLVLICLILGFTVTQYAFRSVEPLYGAAPSELQLRALAVDGAGAATWEWFARRQEIKVSPLVESALGLKTGELSTKVDDFASYLHTADRERFRLMLWSVQERGSGDMRLEFRMRHTDGTYRWFDLEAASIPTSDRKALRCIGLIRDITDVKRAQERLLHDAVHDSLTGLPNRELFADRLEVAIGRAQAEANIRPTVIQIGLDKFKVVNASLGIVVGDSLLLLTIARRLQRHLGAQDTLARVGGDQFAILLTADQNPQDMAMLAERIRRSLRSPIKIAGQEIALTGSLGMAVYDGKQASAADLLKEAEIAMYRAKRGGADRIELFRPEFRTEVDDRDQIEEDLRRAIEKKQLKVLFQPIISLGTEELAGFEAVVRWEHPKLGQINPTEFVPRSDDSDIVVLVGSYVLSQAVREAARWQKELPRVDKPVFVSVNVSSRDLFRQDLVQEIRGVVSKAIVPPGVLRLEVTESLVMENPEQATELLEWLRGAGAGLSLDDFGTGYSSLAFLHRFPFDTIKIDRDLVLSAGPDGGGSPIVRSIVALSHELGKKVIAEGVENGGDVGFLRSIGCEYAQGFYYGEPMSDRDVLALLKVVGKSERKLQRRGFFRTKPLSSRPAREERAPARRPVPAEQMPQTALAAQTADGAMPAEVAAAEAAARSRKGMSGPAVRTRPRTQPAPRVRDGLLPLAPPMDGAGPPPIPSAVPAGPGQPTGPNVALGVAQRLGEAAQRGAPPPRLPPPAPPAPPLAAMAPPPPPAPQQPVSAQRLSAMLGEAARVVSQTAQSGFGPDQGPLDGGPDQRRAPEGPGARPLPLRPASGGTGGAPPRQLPPVNRPRDGQAPNLPPAIMASLQKLAGKGQPPAPTDTDKVPPSRKRSG